MVAGGDCWPRLIWCSLVGRSESIRSAHINSAVFICSSKIWIYLAESLNNKTHSQKHFSFIVQLYLSFYFYIYSCHTILKESSMLEPLRQFPERNFCVQGQSHPINLCPPATAQLIECHFEYHSLLSAYKKTQRQGGSAGWGVIALPILAHHQSWFWNLKRDEGRHWVMMISGLCCFASVSSGTSPALW